MLDSKKRGFTLIELFMVIGISLILVAATLPLYGGFQISSQLNESTSQIMQTIRTAKERSYAGVNDSQHGVYFQSGRYTMYQGSSYALRDSSYDRVIILDNGLSVATTLTGNEINFSKGLALPDNTGTVTVSSSAVSSSRVININSLGLVSQQ